MSAIGLHAIKVLNWKIASIFQAEFIANACEKYRTLASTPIISSAKVISRNDDLRERKYTVVAEYSQQDLVNKEKKIFEKVSTVNLNWEERLIDVNDPSYPTQIKNL